MTATQVHRVAHRQAIPGRLPSWSERLLAGSTFRQCRVLWPIQAVCDATALRIQSCCRWRADWPLAGEDCWSLHKSFFGKHLGRLVAASVRSAVWGRSPGWKTCWPPPDPACFERIVQHPRCETGSCPAGRSARVGEMQLRGKKQLEALDRQRVKRLFLVGALRRIGTIEPPTDLLRRLSNLTSSCGLPSSWLPSS